jgi:hypothetical protein
MRRSLVARALAAVVVLAIAGAPGALTRPAPAQAIDPCSTYYCGYIVFQTAGDGTGSMEAGSNNELKCTYSSGVPHPAPCQLQFAWPHSSGTSISVPWAEFPDVGMGVCDTQLKCSPASLENSGSSVLTANGVTTIYGSFWVQIYTINLGSAGAGTGRIEINRDNNIVDCEVDQSCEVAGTGGNTVTVSALPEPGSVFDHWSGPCAGQGAVCSFVLGSNVTITATWDLAPATPTPAPVPTPTAHATHPPATAAPSAAPNPIATTGSTTPPGSTEPASSAEPASTDTGSTPLPGSTETGSTPGATALPSPVSASQDSGPLLAVVVLLGIVVVVLAVVAAFLFGRTRRPA